MPAANCLQIREIIKCIHLPLMVTGGAWGMLGQSRNLQLGTVEDPTIHKC